MYTHLCIHTYMSILYVAIRGTRCRRRRRRRLRLCCSYPTRETFYLRYKSRGYILITMVQLIRTRNET